jgi:hypothetical protein
VGNDSAVSSFESSTTPLRDQSKARTKLNVRELPRAVSRVLLYRLHQEHERTEAVLSANPRPTTSLLQSSSIYTKETEAKFSPPSREGVDFVWPLFPALNFPTQSFPITPLPSRVRPTHATEIFMPRQSSLFKPWAIGGDGATARNIWRGEMSARVLRRLSQHGFYQVALDEEASIIFGEQAATTLAGQTAPPDLLANLAADAQSAMHDGEALSARRRETTQPDAGGRSINVAPSINSPHGLKAHRLPLDLRPRARDARADDLSTRGETNRKPKAATAEASRGSAAAATDLSSSDLHARTLSGFDAMTDAIAQADAPVGAPLDAELALMDFSVEPADYSAARAALFEHPAATFAEPALAPLIPPQTNQETELPVSVAVARQGARLESLQDSRAASLAESEDLNTLAEKIKLILDEQARRYGIDV